MKIILHLDKSLEENASLYYDKAKKCKKKIEGAKKALDNSLRKLKKLEKNKPEEIITKVKETVKREWYEKFRWFHSSEGFLVVCGKDATSNDIVIKKHMDKEDIVFHTSMPGSPFCIIKTEGKPVTEKTLNETAQQTASYSKAWKLGIAAAEVFHVKPDQVTKTALSGEYIAKGAFMIYGKKNLMTAKLEIAIGNKDGKIIGGPVEAIKAQTKDYVRVTQGKGKTSDIAKKIKKKIGGDLDEIVRFLPAGGCEIKK
ncbi:MAG: NFACT RNA binding domain-containing protein [Nanoarchaeota archaeon]|nr:NFACT RNA binding domain-containing protein [Nanoarchaeota archaeon]